MNENTNIENIFRTQLGQSDIPFSEQLWGKLDTELVPVREAYRKERKRRAIAYWTTAAVVLIGGSSILYFASNNQHKNAEKVIINTNPKQSCCSKPTLADRYGIETNPISLENASIEQNNTSSVNNNQENNNSNLVSTETKSNTPLNSKGYNAPKPNGSNVTVVKNNVTKRNPVTTDASIVKAEKTEVALINKKIEIAGNIDIENAVSYNNTQTSNLQSTDIVKTIVKKEEQSVATKTSSIDLSKNAIITDAKQTNNSTKPVFKVQSVGGVNLSSSFNKPSYYGGAQLQLAINQKLIFAGVKLSANDLNHQLLNVDKAGTNPTSADAIIQKMTTIQIPFGYQFLLNKKQPNSTLLSVGFEPTFLTGIQTIYFDNNGVPGGPTTSVANSPLINKAINKFNVSFIAGVQRRISRRTHLFGNVGYGLINITDKQFYNKVSGSNNLKYAQFGLGFDLIK